MIRNLIIMTITLVVFGWAMFAMYDTQLQFAEIIKNPEPPWFIDIPLLPIVVAMLVLGVFAFLNYGKNRKKYKTRAKAIFLPPEFEESDEREKEITAKACRSSYISLFYAFPVLTGLLLMYPIILDAFPYYPIVILLLLPFIQILVYSITWIKSY